VERIQEAVGFGGRNVGDAFAVVTEKLDFGQVFGYTKGSMNDAVGRGLLFPWRAIAGFRFRAGCDPSNIQRIAAFQPRYQA
jgi:hypothetical protein